MIPIVCLSFRCLFLGDLADVADDNPGGLLHCYVKSKLNAARDMANRTNDWKRIEVERSVREYGNFPEVPKGASLSFEKGLRALPEAALKELGEDVRLG